MYPMKRCTKCVEDYELDFFAYRCSTRSTPKRRHADAQGESRRPICMGCEQTAKDERKQHDRMLQKIRDTIRRHAKKFGISRDRLMHHYGWTIEKLRHDALDHYEHKGCGLCEKPFHKGDTMNDLTLDILDPKIEPFYSFNVKWICNACNRMKQLASPVVFAIRLAMWKRWHARQAALKAMPVPVAPPKFNDQWLPGLAPG